jgi:hypothetical protein
VATSLTNVVITVLRNSSAPAGWRVRFGSASQTPQISISNDRSASVAVAESSVLGRTAIDDSRVAPSRETRLSSTFPPAQNSGIDSTGSFPRTARALRLAQPHRADRSSYPVPFGPVLCKFASLKTSNHLRSANERLDLLLTIPAARKRAGTARVGRL